MALEFAFDSNVASRSLIKDAYCCIRSGGVIGCGHHQHHDEIPHVPALPAVIQRAAH